MANVRKSVVLSLMKVNNDNAYSNIVFGNLIDKSNFTDNERKFATALFYGTLERKLTLDYILNSLMPKSFDKIKAFTKEVLRTGAYQIIYMSKIPQSAAVNESVKLIKESKEKYNSGFVNGVLRSLIRTGYSLPEDCSSKSLSVKYSCGENTVNNFLTDYGEEKTVSILNEFLKPSGLYLRVNTLLTNSDELIGLLKNQNIICKRTDIDNCLFVYGNFRFEGNECYRKGLFHIADYTSQYCALSLDATCGERILDVCAAPGGKSFIIAENMKNTGEVISCDLYEHRCDLIKKSAQKLGITNIKVRVADAQIFDGTIGKFDKIICDVPCSGLGVLRRKPEIKYRDTEDYTSLENTQSAILENSAKYLKYGGTLIYSTCTLRKNENEKIVEKFLTAHEDFKLIFSKVFLPDEQHDGFFVAKLSRDVNITE